MNDQTDLSKSAKTLGNVNLPYNLCLLPQIKQWSNNIILNLFHTG